MMQLQMKRQQTSKNVRITEQSGLFLYAYASARHTEHCLGDFPDRNRFVTIRLHPALAHLVTPSFRLVGKSPLLPASCATNVAIWV